VLQSDFPLKVITLYGVMSFGCVVRILRAVVVMVLVVVLVLVVMVVTAAGPFAVVMVGEVVHPKQRFGQS
jgi:hypothetical protein